MSSRNWIRIGALAATTAASAGLAAAGNWKDPATYVLADIPLASFLDDELGISVEDHGIDLGGIGSDLWHGPGDGAGIYWMVTDRGPNGQINPGTGNRRTFPIPEFTPFILQVRAQDGAIEILDVIPLTGETPAELGITGLSNALPRDEKPWDCSATSELAVNPHGVDSEGLVRTDDGTFWIVEEYGPSILKADPAGQIEMRFEPFNLLGPSLQTPTTGYPTVGALPEIFGAKRKRNRGFEGLAVSPDQETLYAVLQSPLSNPTSAVGDLSRNTRILAFDVASETVTAEYVYRFEPKEAFPENDADEIKVSGLAMVDAHRMLVLERTDLSSRVYLVDLRGATDILGSKWDLVATSPSLESLDDAGLAAEAIAVLPKQLVIVLDSTDPATDYPEKIEGLAVLDGKTIAVANDNDFGIGSFSINAPACDLVDSNAESQLLVIRLDKPIKK